MILSVLPEQDPNLHESERGFELSGQDVHIHYLDVRRLTAGHHAEAERIMSSAERERAKKFIRGKESYIASRWLLRSTLARYLGLAPATMEFLRTDKGKPYLPQRGIYFSLSHSGHWAMLAVSKAELIGLDLEVVTISNTQELIGIARNYYHPKEFAHLQALTDSAQTNYFYRLWTLKEAFFKAIGTGISAGLEKIVFDFSDDRIHGKIAESINEDSSNWQFHQWTQDTQVYCALACKSQHPLQIRWFDASSTSVFTSDSFYMPGMNK